MSVVDTKGQQKALHISHWTPHDIAIYTFYNSTINRPPILVFFGKTCSTWEKQLFSSKKNNKNKTKKNKKTKTKTDPSFWTILNHTSAFRW